MLPPLPSRNLHPGTLTLLGLLLGSAGCRAAYVGRAAWHQAGLMAKREPIDRVIERGDLDPQRAAKLALIPEIKAYGETLGLGPSRNYETISARWQRSIYNLSACEPLSLEPVGWWFPVVGEVPYLGFFRQQDVARWESRYRERGYDVHVRDVAAYSTLGWFRDPVLPAMLDWQEYRLAEVVLHELTHATLWVPGSVSFNETLANVVGEEAATRWMLHRYGAESREIEAMQLTREDHATWRGLLEELYQDLDALYKNENMLDEDKLAAKGDTFEGIEQRVLSAGFHQPGPYAKEAREGAWSNARVAQYRTYNHSREAFDLLLDQRDGDLRALVDDVRKITEEGKDPWSAIEEATAAAGEETK
jgi:predicted aminopeptidase